MPSRWDSEKILPVVYYRYVVPKGTKSLARDGISVTLANSSSFQDRVPSGRHFNTLFILWIMSITQGSGCTTYYFLIIDTQKVEGEKISLDNVLSSM